MNRLDGLIFGFLLILLASNVVNGCTCGLPLQDTPISRQVINARTQAKAVFVGKVLIVESPPDILYNRVTMEIASVWKGTSSEKLIILTGRGGSCGFPFEPGGTYLVYAYQSNETSLGTNICFRTTVYHDELVDLKHLGKPKFRRVVS